MTDELSSNATGYNGRNEWLAPIRCCFFRSSVCLTACNQLRLRYRPVASDRSCVSFQRVDYYIIWQHGVVVHAAVAVHVRICVCVCSRVRRRRSVYVCLNGMVRIARIASAPHTQMTDVRKRFLFSWRFKYKYIDVDTGGLGVCVSLNW